MIWHQTAHANYLNLIFNQKATKIKPRVTFLNLLPLKKRKKQKAR